MRTERIPRFPENLGGNRQDRCLGGRKESLPWLLQEISALGEDFNLWACEDLTLETERIRELNYRTAADWVLSSRTIFVLVRKGSIL